MWILGLTRLEKTELLPPCGYSLKVYGVFSHRFVFVVVKTSALERSLFLLLVPERVDVGTQAALCARFVTISWWTWFTSTRMEVSTAADTTLRCLSRAVLLVMRWENLISMLPFDRLCCFLVVRTTLGARDFSYAVSGCGQVLKRLRRSCLRPSAEHVSACGRQNEAPRRTREKTSATQGRCGRLRSPNDVQLYTNDWKDTKHHTNHIFVVSRLQQQETS